MKPSKSKVDDILAKLRDYCSSKGKKMTWTRGDVSDLVDLLEKFEKKELLNEILAKLVDAGAPLKADQPSITQARAELAKANINLWQLSKDQIKVFPSFQALKKYTLGGRNKKRTFPREVAKELGIRDLLKDFGCGR